MPGTTRTSSSTVKSSTLRIRSLKSQKILAGSNSALGNNDKYLEYANVVIEEKGVAESFDFAYNIFQQERSTENWDAAAGWANRLKALSAAPPVVSVADWRNMGIEFQRSIARGGIRRRAIPERHYSIPDASRYGPFAARDLEYLYGPQPRCDRRTRPGESGAGPVRRRCRAQ